jgi:hypothetical protein
MARKIFVLTHVHELSPDREDLKLIGVYSTERRASAAVDRARLLPGFAQIPDGFHVQSYPLDKDHWIEGFVTELPASQSNKGKRKGKMPRRRRARP